MSERRSKMNFRTRRCFLLAGTESPGDPPGEKTSEDNLTMVFGCWMCNSRLISHKCTGYMSWSTCTVQKYSDWPKSKFPNAWVKSQELFERLPFCQASQILPHFCICWTLDVVSRCVFFQHRSCFNWGLWRQRGLATESGGSHGDPTCT